ncbi:MAG TPA: pentapeptide repeat-containing protein [Ktedonobacteraceae bacterium]|nr:pentapeptide repeat-containing protein [Ktedonobacteraceae bacterium]
MADQHQVLLLKQGAKPWNTWRKEHPEIQPDLSQVNLGRVNLGSVDLSRAVLINANFHRTRLRAADLSEASLINAHLRGADLSEANFSGAKLRGTDLSEANLSYADLRDADLQNADLHGANLSGANLSGANLREANLSGANLTSANLSRAFLIGTNLARSTLNECLIYGTSVWDVQLAGAVQLNLIITPRSQPTITVDNLKIAQFIYLLLNNQEIRDAITTITSKVVLLLGRFTPERKMILNALRGELRKQNYLPVVFDFEKPASRDLTETVNTLAHLARFIIVDLTDPSSVPHEIATIIPQCVVPVQPLLTLQPLMVEAKAVERHEYAMFQDLRRRYHWVLPTFHYQDTADILLSLKEKIIAPAEQKAKELAKQE